MGPLRRDATASVRAFLRCGDLAAGFTRFHCPDCGHEKLLAFTCKARHFCPACHQRRVRRTGAWIAASVCHDVPHRKFVFTFPKILRGIFRKRRHLLHLLFQTATACLRDAFRTRLGLPEGRIAAAAAVHTFGDYLVFHPHLHLLAADGLFDAEGRFHSMPQNSLAPITDLFRHRFLQTLRDGRVIDLPPPPDPPFDIETFEPIEPPWQAIREWIPDDDAELGFDLFDQRPASGKPVEIPREDGTILVLDSD